MEMSATMSNTCSECSIWGIIHCWLSTDNLFCAVDKNSKIVCTPKIFHAGGWIIQMSLKTWRMISAQELTPCSPPLTVVDISHLTEKE